MMERSDIKACENHLMEMDMKGEQREREIESAIVDEEIKLLRDTIKWMAENLDHSDIEEKFAAVLMISALKFKEPEFVGKCVIDMTKVLLRRAAEAGYE